MSRFVPQTHFPVNRATDSGFGFFMFFTFVFFESLLVRGRLSLL